MSAYKTNVLMAFFALTEIIKVGLECGCMLKPVMLHVPSRCGHPIFRISDILFIKKYPEMGRRYYRIISSRKGLLYWWGQSTDAVSPIFY